MPAGVISTALGGVTAARLEQVLGAISRQVCWTYTRQQAVLWSWHGFEDQGEGCWCQKHTVQASNGEILPSVWGLNSGWMGVSDAQQHQGHDYGSFEPE